MVAFGTIGGAWSGGWGGGGAGDKWECEDLGTGEGLVGIPFSWEVGTSILSAGNCSCCTGAFCADCCCCCCC